MDTKELCIYYSKAESGNQRLSKRREANAPVFAIKTERETGNQMSVYLLSIPKEKLDPKSERAKIFDLRNVLDKQINRQT